MSRHILDRSRPATGARAEHFAEIERRKGPEGSTGAAKALHRRPQTRTGGKTGRFLGIERGAEK